MTHWNHRRLWTPAITALAGSTVAAAFGIREGWGPALVTEFVSLGLATVLYMVGGEDTDTRAILGQHDDERQRLVAFQAARLSLTVALGATVIACVVAAAANYPFWPFEVLADVIGVSYLVGLRIYGMSPQEPTVPLHQDATGGATF